MQVGDTLEEFLLEATSDAKLRQTMMSLSEAVRTIAFKVSCHAAHLFYNLKAALCFTKCLGNTHLLLVYVFASPASCSSV